MNLSGAFTIFNLSSNEPMNSSVITNEYLNGTFNGTVGVHPTGIAGTSYILTDPTIALQFGVVISYCLFFIFLLGIISELMKYEENLRVWAIIYLIFFLILSALAYLINTYLTIVFVLIFLLAVIGIMLIDRLLCVRIFSDNLTTKEVKGSKLFHLLIGNLILAIVLIAFQIYAAIYEIQLNIYVLSIVTVFSWGLSLGSIQVLFVVIKNLDISNYQQWLLERLKI